MSNKFTLANYCTAVPYSSNFRVLLYKLVCLKYVKTHKNVYLFFLNVSLCAALNVLKLKDLQSLATFSLAQYM